MVRIKLLIKKNPLFFAFFFPAVMDGTMTLLGQDASYWTSRVVNEGSPAYFFLLASPWFFILGSVVWFVFWYQIFRRIKEPFNVFLMFLFIAGHSWGSGSWIWRMMRVHGLYTVNNQTSVLFAWGIAVVYFALIALLATYCLRIYLEKR